MVFQFFTNVSACSISLFHSSDDQVPTPPLEPQKWPLKWVPISWPSSQAPRICATVALIPLTSLKPMSEAPALCLGGLYSPLESPGSM